MKSKKEVLIQFLIVVLCLVYLFVDVIHFITDRSMNGNPAYLEAAYENYQISYVKWTLVIIALSALSLLNSSKYKVLALATLLVVSFQILLIFILKGKLSTLMTGSFAFNFFILELASVLMIALGLLLQSHIFISKKLLLLIFSVSLIVYLTMVSPIPNYVPL